MASYDMVIVYISTMVSQTTILNDKEMASANEWPSNCVSIIYVSIGINNSKKQLLKIIQYKYMSSINHYRSAYRPRSAMFFDDYRESTEKA